MGMPIEGDSEVGADLEKGVTAREEDRSKDLVSADSQRKKRLKRALGGVLRFDSPANGKSGPDLTNSNLRHGEVASDNIALLVDRSLRENRPENIPILDKKCVKEKHPRTNSRKPPKPPRPPKGPLLNDADRKLAKDIAEAAMRKRMRVEQMRTLRKDRAANTSTSSLNSSSIVAMFITVLFFLVMIFQGISSKTAEALQGSPGSYVPVSKDLISVQPFKSLSASETSSVSSDSSNSTCLQNGCVSDLSSKETANLSHQARRITL